MTQHSEHALFPPRVGLLCATLSPGMASLTSSAKICLNELVPMVMLWMLNCGDVPFLTSPRFRCAAVRRRCSVPLALIRVPGSAGIRRHSALVVLNSGLLSGAIISDITANEFAWRSCWWCSGRCIRAADRTRADTVYYGWRPLRPYELLIWHGRFSGCDDHATGLTFEVTARKS